MDTRRCMDTPCWHWLGSHRSHDSRPVTGNKGHTYAYRETYKQVMGRPCPPGVAHHRCENKWCVNPWHLDFITPSEHAREHDTLGTFHRTKTHCPQNHEYSRENTLIKKRGDGTTFRQCRTCQRDYFRNRRAKAAAKRAAAKVGP